MEQYIYSRVSTGKQDTGNQLASLRERYPNASIVEETASGAKERPLLAKLVAGLDTGDTLIVAALDRLGRRTSEILALIEGLDKRGITVISVREGADFSTPVGRMIMTVLLSVAQLERDLIGERTRMALQAKKAKGVKLGGPVKYGTEVVEKVRLLRNQGLTMRAIAVQVGLSASRVCELCQDAAPAASELAV